MAKKKAAKNKAAVAKRKKRENVPAPMTAGDVEVFEDDEEIVDDFLSKTVSFNENTEEGTAFQGILLGAFVNEKGDYGPSVGYNFLGIGKNDAGEPVAYKATVWGTHVLDRIFSDPENEFQPPCFVTIIFKGIRGRTLTFKVSQSQAGYDKYSHLLDEKKIDLSTYKWLDDLDALPW